MWQTGTDLKGRGQTGARQLLYEPKVKCFAELDGFVRGQHVSSPGAGLMAHHGLLQGQRLCLWFAFVLYVPLGRYIAGEVVMLCSWSSIITSYLHLHTHLCCDVLSQKLCLQLCLLSASQRNHEYTTSTVFLFLQAIHLYCNVTAWAAVTQ